MLTINTFSIAFLVQISTDLTVPIQLFSTKIKQHGPFFIGDIIIPNSKLKAAPSDSLYINVSIKIHNDIHKYILPMTYNESENAWVFIADKTIIKYSIYTLIFPFNLEVEIDIVHGPNISSMKKTVALTDDKSLIFLPNSDAFISLEILESNYLIKPNNIVGPFELVITAINTNVSKKIKLTSVKDRYFLSGEPSGCLYINEILLKQSAKVEKIVLNKIDMFEEPFYLKGTLIQTPSGFKPIETIKTGSKILNQRNRPIDVISTYSCISSWVDGVIFKKGNLLIHKGIKTMGSDGLLCNPTAEGLAKATKQELCGASDVCVCYSIEIASPADKLILTDGIIADSFLNKKRPKQVFISVYSQKFIKEIE